MKTFRLKPIWFLLFFLYFFTVTVPSAHAYLDPGTGSYLFQIVIGAALGAAVAIKVFWKKIWALITRKRPRRAAPEADPVPSATEDP